jgi:hypothetical protein
VFLIWTDDFAIVPRTAAMVFPYVRFYKLTKSQAFLVVSNAPMQEHPLRKTDPIAAFEDPQHLAKALRRTLPLLDGGGVKRITDGLPVNRDWRPVSGYYLGLQARLKEILHR